MPREHSGGEALQRDRAGVVDDALVDRAAAASLVGRDEPLVAARDEVLGELLPVRPPAVPIGGEAAQALVEVLAELEHELVARLERVALLRLALLLRGARHQRAV
jgi:hypothetical protein